MNPGEVCGWFAVVLFGCFVVVVVAVTALVGATAFAFVRDVFREDQERNEEWKG